MESPNVRGQDGLVDCIRDWDRQALQHLEARGGIAIEQEVWNLFTLRDGKTLRWEIFLTRPPV